MIVPSLPFLGFAAAGAVVFNLSKAVAWRRAILLVLNLLFLASFSHDLVAFVPFASFIALGYLAQNAVRRGRSTALFVVMLLVTLAAFFWLKRYIFVPSAFVLPFPYLLVGLSYVFFRVMHVIIDRHQGAIEADIASSPTSTTR